ncbi:MAG: hypothetical protein ACREJB_16260, partial [Planctomycetaceae bacterium]
MVRPCSLCWFVWPLIIAGSVTAGEPETKTAATLERIAPSPQLLEAPDGLTGEFTVARTPPQIDFAIYPGQWEGAKLWSSWGDSLFASDGSFYASIGDHAAPHGTAYVYRVDPKSRSVERVVDYNAVVQQPEGNYTPGKIHGALVEGDDRHVYFFGYRGSERRTTAEANYRGDWLLRYDPRTEKTENLGIAVPFHSVPVLVAHPESKSLYGLSVAGLTAPDQLPRFFHYD